MNAKLRTDFLTRLWLRATSGDWGRMTPQALYAVPETAKIETIYMEVLDKFLGKTLPWFNKVIEAETNTVIYEFPAPDECVRHMLYEVLLKNRTTFVRFFINTYLTHDQDAVLNSQDLWAYVLQWARQFDINPQYLPVAQIGLNDELENLGYLRCRGTTGVAFWGLKIG